MCKEITHELVGYHPDTDEWVWSVKLPRERIEEIKRMVHIDVDDPDAVFSYELEPAKARDIAGLIGAGPLDPALVYYLEPYAEAAADA
jgi:hypothetical protein